MSLFDGKTLAGWKAATEGPASFGVVDGTIACDGPKSHLFYVGRGRPGRLRELRAVGGGPHAAGRQLGVFFHTAYQEKDWPSQGFEVQVDNSQKQHGDYLEMKMTGSLYGIRNVYKAMAKDDEWFTMNVLVRRPRVQVRVNGALVVDWIEPAGPLPEGAPKVNRLGRGTFALQCHDPESKVFFRNLRVRPLPTPRRGRRAHAARERALRADPRARQGELPARRPARAPQGRAHPRAGARPVARHRHVPRPRRQLRQGLPHPDGRRSRGVRRSMKGQPVFVGMQAEGREWVSMFSKETRARFDYVFTDGMTWTNPAGKRMRLWIPEEVEIGPDEEAFMDLLVSKIVGILETEPIDIYVNPTFLPAVIAARYDALWTEARMAKVIDAAVKSGVAIEINGRYKIPSERFLRLAKSKGAKFTFGTNNAGAADLGDWSYPLAMQKALGLTWKDMFVPGHQPSRAQRE